MLSPSFKGCTSGTFVDVGANIGDSLQMWYEREGCWDLKPRWEASGKPWPGIRASGCRWEFPQWLPLSKRQTYCAQVFEPNPRLAAALMRTARSIERRFGVRVEVFNGTAFSTTAGMAPFRLDSAAGAVGSSLLLSKSSHKGDGSTHADMTMVRTIDGLAHLRAVRPGPVALKVDVEGMEHLVLRDLLLSGVLCERVSNLWVEWHTAKQLGQAATAPAAGGGPSPTAINEVYKWMLRTAGPGARQRAHISRPSRQRNKTVTQEATVEPGMAATCQTRLLEWA